MSETISTPWPIEKGPHPIGSLAEQREAPELEALGVLVEEVLRREAPETFDRKAFLEMVFARPQYFRDLILRHVKVVPREGFEGKGIFYVWLNKSCPVGCEFCFFKSPAKGQVEIPEGPEGIGRLVEFINGGEFKKVFVTGGGEPMMKPDEVNELIQMLKADQMILITSAYFAQSERGARAAIERLRASADSNPQLGSLVFRFSLDEGHVGRLGSRGRGFKYAHNLMKVIQETSKGPEDKMRLLIHTMMGDGTVDQFLEQLDVEERVNSGSEFSRKTQVRLKGGFTFVIEYSQTFDSDVNVNLTEGSKAEYNGQTFQDYVTHRATEQNMILAPVPAGAPRGLKWTTFYDGVATVWSSTPPDNEATIYGDTYDTAMERYRGDVIILGTMENGTFYRDDIVEEVNPRAVLRARAMGLRDQYARVLLEEEGTRLFLAVRMAQDFLEHGRLTAEEVATWPEAVRALILSPKEELIEACQSSKHDIVAQYLADPKVTLEKLQALYRMVRLGHYGITPIEMARRVFASVVSADIKRQFADCIWSCTAVRSYVSQFSHPDEMAAAAK